MALADTANLAVKITLDDRGFTGPLNKIQRNLGGLNKGFGRVGKGVGQLGTGLARAGTILAGVAVGGIALATREALNFEDAFAGVRKTVSEAELTAAGTSFDELRQTFLRMSSEMPLAATEFARLGEIAGALGVRAQDIDDFAKTTALLGVTTNLTADEAADALGRIGTILDFTGQDFQHFSDILVNLGNQGASTEAEIIEITKRFAGVGSQAGLSVEQITALASSISSLGAAPEAAGSALSRIFANLTTEIANGSAKGKEFAEVTGDSLDELKKRIDQGDALGIFMETLEELSTMSRTEQASVLKALGITNVRDRDAIVKMAGNLDEVNRQLNVAQNSTGALAAEAAKRFDSPLQKLITLRGAAIRLAIAFGDGITPAIGRAADKLAGFFRDEGNLSQATELGENIGKAIDEIDWAKVIAGAKQFGGVLKGAFEFALLILKTLDKLPGEIKAAGVGFLALNKLSGGLIAAGAGNVIGGLAEAGARGVAGRLPGIGKLFAQPVIVTNWPPGFGMGGGVTGAAKGGIGAVGKMFLVGEAIGLALLVKEVADNVTTAARDQALTIGQSLTRSLQQPNTLPQLQQKLDGINSGINQINAMGNIPAALFHDTLVELERQQAQVVAAIRSQAAHEKTAREDVPADVVARTPQATLAALKQIGANTRNIPEQTTKRQQPAFSRLRERIDAGRLATVTASQREQARLTALRIGQGAAKIAQIAAGRSDTARMISAIHAARPIVSVVVNAATNYTTTVKTGTTSTKREADINKANRATEGM